MLRFLNNASPEVIMLSNVDWGLSESGALSQPNGYSTAFSKLKVAISIHCTNDPRSLAWLFAVASARWTPSRSRPDQASPVPFTARVVMKTLKLLFPDGSSLAAVKQHDGRALL